MKFLFGFWHWDVRHLGIAKTTWTAWSEPTEQGTKCYLRSSSLINYSVPEVHEGVATICDRKRIGSRTGIETFEEIRRNGISPHIDGNREITDEKKIKVTEN